METREQPPQTRTVDVTGLTEEQIRRIERIEELIASYRRPADRLGGTTEFATREEWIKAFHDWVDSHKPLGTNVNYDRGDIYDGRGE